MKDYVIVGAGVAGLTLGYYLCKAGLPVTILEREDEVGGLARSFHYGGEWHYDIGPHRFYTANPLVLNFLNDIQGDNFLEIARFSSVYYLGSYHQWPLRLQTVFKLPPLVALRAGIDLLFKKNAVNEQDRSFRNYTLARYGKTLYETFFQDYTEKFVGIPAEDTHQDWAKVGVERATIDDKVDTASLRKIFKLMLLPKPSELHFLYPSQDGIHSFWKSCARKIKKLGGNIITGVTPKRLEQSQGKVTKVITEQGEFECQHLAWSAPINELTDLLGMPKPNLKYRSHLLYNVMLKRPPLQRYQWCYYGSKDLVFSRISNPETFSPYTIPSGKGALCIEIACQEGDKIWRHPESVRKKVTSDLAMVRIIEDPSQIEDIRYERVPNAYPVYHLNYHDELQKIDAYLNSMTNVKLLGRTGRFWYNNMDNSIENACAHAIEIIANMPEKTDKLQEVLQALQEPPTNPKHA